MHRGGALADPAIQTAALANAAGKTRMRGGHVERKAGCKRYTHDARYTPSPCESAKWLMALNESAVNRGVKNSESFLTLVNNLSKSMTYGTSIR